MAYEWIFRRALTQGYAYAIQSKLGKSEKAIRSWSQPPESPFHRTNPIETAVKIFDVLDERDPQALFELLDQIVKRYGYSICSQKQKDYYSISDLNKELNDVIQTWLEVSEDGQITMEEIKRFMKEMREALYALNQKIAELEGGIDR